MCPMRSCGCGCRCGLGPLDPGQLGRYCGAPRRWGRDPVREQGPGRRAAGRGHVHDREAALTGAALAMTGYSRVLGKKLEKAGGEPVEGGSDPSPVTSPDVAKVQRQLKVCQCSCRG
jgi:hypothetical protein